VESLLIELFVLEALRVLDKLQLSIQLERAEDELSDLSLLAWAAKL
jgi:hypothetical protein